MLVSLQRHWVHWESEERLKRLQNLYGPHIRSLHLKMGCSYMFTSVLPAGKDERVELDAIRDLHLQLWHHEALWYASRFIGSPLMETLDMVLHTGGNIPNQYSNMATSWFEKAPYKIKSLLSDLRLIVDDYMLWRAIRHAVLKFLKAMKSICTLEFHIEMLTPDFVAALSKMSRERGLTTIKGVGERKILVLGADDPEGDGDDGSRTPRPTDQIVRNDLPPTRHSLRILSLYASLPATTNLLSKYYAPGILTHLEITLSNKPTQNSFANFMRFIGSRCPSLKVLKIFFSQYHSAPGAHTLDWTILQPLRKCTALEELEIEHGPVIDLCNTDVPRMAAAWPKLQTLKLSPHPDCGKSFIVPSLAALLYLAERCPSVTELTLPFSTLNPSEKLQERAKKAKSLEVLASDDERHLLEESAERSFPRIDPMDISSMEGDDLAWNCEMETLPTIDHVSMVLGKDIDGFLKLSSVLKWCDVRSEENIRVERMDESEVWFMTPFSYRNSGLAVPSKASLMALSSELQVEGLLEREDTLTEEDFL